jgi:hypothetical protein
MMKLSPSSLSLLQVPRILVDLSLLESVSGGTPVGSFS